MTTWIDVIKLAETLRGKKEGGHALDGNDADRLLTMVLDFHRRAVLAVPTADRSGPPLPRSSR
ncbi:MAG TPA: hypothetical protein VGL81_16520 [Polyangiaceae bacterium]|jgi:hypothetical protein